MLELYKEHYKASFHRLQDIGHHWPECTFSHATWESMAASVKGAYKNIKEMEQPLPSTACVGSRPIRMDGMECECPITFPWMGFKGLNIVDHDEEDSVYACRILASILLRIFMQAAPGRLLIHQVDPRRMGAELRAVPVQSEAPRLDTASLERLLSQLQDEMNATQVNGWKTDALTDAFSADTRPVHIIAIANWDDLAERRGDESELSQVQKIILRMLETDMAARHGIYFFICSDDEVKAGSLPVLEAHDEEHVTLHAAQADKEGAPGIDKDMDLRFSTPTEAQLEQLHAAHRNYVSGSLEDEDGKGIWLGNSAKGLRAIMGTTPLGENQFFEMGVGRANNAFHALVGGATGSGKSVLLNEIICSLAERYSPEELRMILLDYKEGTEFAPYRNLPHMYALSIGSNPEFGVECLKWVSEETERRGQLFKKAGVSNLADYRRVTGEKMCRYIIVADEFQILCTDKKHGEEARRLLNDLARRTRSFGMNLLLATQTLRDGALEGEAKNQFACRICLALAESETDLFLSSGNDEPAHFTRKGQALLNYALGMKSGNIPFQSGNRNAANGMFRTTAEINTLLHDLQARAAAEGLELGEQYVYDGEGYADVTPDMLDAEQGFIIGRRNNMTAAPFYLSRRHMGGGMLVVGTDERKKKALLNLISRQSAAIYGSPCPIQSPTGYLDDPVECPMPIICAEEGDMDLDECMASWKESCSACREQEQAPAPAAQPAPSPLDGSFELPEGMEGMEGFADMMQTLQTNCAAMNAAPAPQENSGHRRRRKENPVVVAVHSSADIKLMEAGGVYLSDFRIVVYLDMVTFNQLSSEYESGALAESQIIIEYPRGVNTKIRLANIN